MHVKIVFVQRESERLIRDWFNNAWFCIPKSSFQIPAYENPKPNRAYKTCLNLRPIRQRPISRWHHGVFCLPIYSTTIAFQPRTVSPECSFFSSFSLSRTSQQPWLISGSTKMRQLSRCRATVQNTCLLLILLDMTFWCVIDENTRAENELKKRNRLTFDSLLRLLIL